MASSSSSIASPKLYDAFISHRGPDVKETLAKQLYELLHERGCRTFLDRPEIQVGDSITFAIRSAISSSLVQIAIFSRGYAESSWCLDELVFMLKQTDTLFIPIFYDVEPWELRHTENPKSPYAKAFSDYQNKGRYLDKLDEWKKAIQSAADISGYQHSPSSHPGNLCENIVTRVLQEVQQRNNKILLEVAKYPVGLAELVEDFESSFSETRRGKRAKTVDEVTIAGIYGLGGSGKTTLAKELFNRKSSAYHGSSFLFDVRESHVRCELHRLQSQLLKDLLKIEGLNISSVDRGIGELKQRLGRARQFSFLIVLDDIDHLDQLDALLPQGVLSSNSLVIITTRDQSMLTDADIRYKMKGLNRVQAKDLFCNHAFSRLDPPFTYEKMVESFLQFCGGLPLSLKVLGAHLKGRNEHYWEFELEKVKKIQPKDIMRRLKISFDSLDQEEKQIFIDIACLFNKNYRANLSMVKSFWRASGWSAEHAVQTLQDKCLVEVVSYGRFEMHDHLRDLGRQMADELGPPRLWRTDITRSLEEKGFQQILTETKGRCFHSFWDSSNTEITYFIGNSNGSAETDLLGLDFRFLKHGASKEIPPWVPLRKLHYLSVLNVRDLWSTFHQQLETNTQAGFALRKLRIIDCRRLQKLPDLIGMFSHLEELEIEDSFEKTPFTFLEEIEDTFERTDFTSLQGIEDSVKMPDFTALHGIGDFIKMIDLEPWHYIEKTDLESLEGIEDSSRMIDLESLPWMEDSIEKIDLESLEGVGDFSGMTDLESLRGIEDSIEKIDLESLEGIGDSIEMTDLESLRGIEDSIEMTDLRMKLGLQESIRKMDDSFEMTDLESLLESIKQLNTLRSLRFLSNGSVFYRERSLNLSRGRESTSLEAFTSNRISSLETIYFRGLGEIEKLLVSGEFCPRLQSLTVEKFTKLETISISGLTALKVFQVEECEGLRSLTSLAHQRHLEHFTVSGCDKLQSVEGSEEGEWGMLKSLTIEVPENGYEWVRNCIYGFKMLPSEKTLLVGKPADTALSRLDVNLFSEVTGIEEVVEMQRGVHTPLRTRSSSNAITIYVFLSSSQYSSYIGPISIQDGSERMITVLLPHGNSEGISTSSIRVKKGFRVLVNKRVEGKALLLIQRIVDGLYR